MHINLSIDIDTNDSNFSPASLLEMIAARIDQSSQLNGAGRYEVSGSPASNFTYSFQADENWDEHRFRLELHACELDQRWAAANLVATRLNAYLAARGEVGR